MPDRVEIIVSAKDSASQVLRGVSSGFGSIGSAIQSLTSGVGLEALTSQIIAFGKESVDATVKYANEVRNLSMISGESTENTSRFLQVLDDYKLSAQDALTATRALTKQGLSPNIDTLAQLSDQYLSLNTAEAKNDFILKNLGRSGLQWVEVLNKGSAAIRAQGDAIDESLILTQKAVDDARKYEIALDNWNDSVQALKISIGSQLLPVLTNLTNGMNEGQRAAEIMTEQGLNPANKGSQEYRAALAQAHAEQEKMTEAMISNAAATEQNTIDQKAQEEAIKALTKVNQDYLSTLGTISDGIADTTKKEQELQAEHASLLAEKQNLINQGWWPESEKILDVNQKLAENEKAQQSNATEFETASRRRMLASAEEKLSIDGLTVAERDALQQQGIEWGLYTQQAVDRMNQEQAEIDRLVAKYSTIPTSISTTITTIHQDVYKNPILSGGIVHARAGGGPAAAGMLYRVNETRTEYFRPSMSGTVVPLGGGASGGGNGGNTPIQIVYSPAVSLGDKSEFYRAMPAIIQGIRKAKADGII